MVLRISKITPVLAVVLSLFGFGHACSVMPGEFFRSNFEMIEAADAIVVATAQRRAVLPNIDGDRGVVFVVNETLKGDAPKRVIKRWGQFGDVPPSDPEEISQAHPNTFAGACSRTAFEQGRKYVLMLGKSPDGKWYVGVDGLDRASEDDYGPASNWRRVIRHYLAIQQNPDRMAQLKDMEQLVFAGQDPKATSYEQRLGTDALLHLLTIHPDKPTEWLLERFSDPDYVPRTFDDLVEDTSEETATRLASLIYSKRERDESNET